MELFMAWIGTIVLSLGMEIITELQMFKDAADNGYKIDTKRFSEFAKQMNPNATKTILISLLIPIINIIGVFQRTIQYNNVRHVILDQLSVMDTLIPMTKKEEKKYKKKPSGLNALIITIKSQVEEEPTSISYTDGNEKSTIWFKLENGNFIMVKSDGPISNLSFLEQRAILVEKLKMMSEEITSIMSTDEYENIDLTNIPSDGKATKTISLNGQKQQLEDLKTSIMNCNMSNTTTKESNGETFVKKYK